MLTDIAILIAVAIASALAVGMFIDACSRKRT